MPLVSTRPQQLHPAQTCSPQLVAWTASRAWELTINTPAAGVSRLAGARLSSRLPAAAASQPPPAAAGPAGACVGTAGKFAATGSSYMDGADDVAFLEVGAVGDAAEACCTMCSEREGCVAWDTYREGPGSYLCQVNRMR